MSDSEATAEGEEKAPAATPAAKPPKVVLGLLAVNLVATGFVAFKVATASPVKSAAAANSTPQVVVARDEIKGPVVSLDPFVVNLNEPEHARYAKITIELELGGKEAVKALEKGKQLVRDSIMTYLSGLRLPDTLGSENRAKIRDDLMDAITEVMGEGRVRRMFFTEFVVQ